MQVLTEFLQFDSRFNGVPYRSGKLSGGTCVVLFADRNDVRPQREAPKRKGARHLLYMKDLVSSRAARLPEAEYQIRSEWPEEVQPR